MAAAPGPPDVALVSLSIHNFRGIDHLELNFRGPDNRPNHLVVLAGPNGCGKTAVLEAALIVVGGHKLAVGRRGKGAVRRGAKDYKIEGVVEIQRKPTPRTFTCTDSSKTQPPEPAREAPFWYFSSWRAPLLVGPVDITIGKPGRRPAKTDVKRLLNVKQQLVNNAAIERFRGGPHAQNSSYSTLMESINVGWREFYPETNLRFFVDLTEPDSEEQGAFDVFLGEPGASRLEVDCLSAGQIELFLFLSALAINGDQQGIVLIDEPELHLDPQWHRPIIRSLMKLQPRAQFIVATHSPEIYDAARSYERHFLVSEDDPRSRLWSEVRGVEARN